jgi:hypothetical protein
LLALKDRSMTELKTAKGVTVIELDESIAEIFLVKIYSKSNNSDAWLDRITFGVVS